MGCQRLIVLSAFFVFAKDYEVSAQYATVLECLPQPTAAIARPIVQPAGPYIFPAVIQPDLAPSYPNYGNCPAPYSGYPPIILKDDDDLLRNLLYFLIFSMGNKKDNSNPLCRGGGSCGSGKCKCCCDCPNCSKNIAKDPEVSSSPPIYIPVPIAIPVYTGPDGCKYIDGFCDDILLQDYFGCNCNSGCGKEPSEINFVIRTD